MILIQTLTESYLILNADIGVYLYFPLEKNPKNVNLKIYKLCFLIRKSQRILSHHTEIKNISHIFWNSEIAQRSSHFKSERRPNYSFIKKTTEIFWFLIRETWKFQSKRFTWRLLKWLKCFPGTITSWPWILKTAINWRWSQKQFSRWRSNWSKKKMTKNQCISMTWIWWSMRK